MQRDIFIANARFIVLIHVRQQLHEEQMENYTPLEARPVYRHVYRFMTWAEPACRALTVFFLTVFIGRLVAVWSGLV
ncbi:hypothetical protein [Sulfitobacter indolifex]|uniref:hypothetical protein n=1 Tax=Sulfitobacter indolifex TaxID=225422 RepID=UPI00104A97CF|nr:hypothetical protein [Sulfitobacter indolifex]